MEQILDQDKSQVSVRYAGFWIRFVAYIVDGIILGIVGNLTSALFFGSALNTFGSELSDINWGLYSTASLVNIAIYWLYFALMESSEKQATLGKMVVGVKVVDRNYERINFGKATARYFSKILSALILMIGFIMAGFDSRKQALHDKLVDTFVIYGRG